MATAAAPESFHATFPKAQPCPTVQVYLFIQDRIKVRYNNLF